jgi:hypothetical protein
VSCEKNQRRWLLLAPLFALLLASGCAATIQYPPLPDQAKKVEDPTKSRVYVMRSRSFFGWEVPYRYYSASPEATGPRSGESMHMVGEVGPGGYLCWETTPITMRIETIEDDTNSIVTLDLKPGNVYYLRSSLKLGWERSRTVIQILDDQAGEAMLKQCKPPDDYRH